MPHPHCSPPSCRPFHAGCAPSHYSKGISSFAAAAAPALDKVDASYTAVNDVHIFEEQTELVAQYDTSGYRPGQIKALISSEELETRTQAISVLRRYSQAIGDLAAGKHAQTAFRSLSPAPVAPTRATLEAAARSTYNAYWDVKDHPVAFTLLLSITESNR